MTAPLAIDGPAAPPRSNGELLFAEPWESRAFGMAVSLHEAGTFAWETFQAALIARIGAWEAEHPGGDGYRYYRHWLDALEDVLVAGRAVERAEVDERAAKLSARPAGHDHADGDPGHTHGDGHGHGHDHHGHGH